MKTALHSLFAFAIAATPLSLISAETSTASATSANEASTAIRRVTEDVVERQFTARSLIGQDVYDNQGKKVGEVRDVVLDPTRAPQLAMELSLRATTRTSGNAGSTSAAAAGPGVNSTVGSGNVANTSTAPSGSAARASSATTAPDAALTAVGSGTAAEPAVIVSYGGFMGAGGTLFRVPMSQLRFDRASGRLALNVGDSELASLKNTRSPNAAE